MTAPAGPAATAGAGVVPAPLAVADDDLASCVGCGLCLPHCPTYRVTGEEAASPRGRIAAMKAVQWDGAEPGEAFVGFMSACVQCRGCETACPSGVPYGRLMEGTRASLAASGRITPWWQRAGLRVLGHHRLLLAGSRTLAVAQRLRLVPRRVALPTLPLRSPALRPSAPHGPSEPVWLFTGCVMDAWQRPTHQAALDVLARAGAEVRLPGGGAACCGALHTHAGLGPEARRLAERVIAAFPGDAPVLVDSAGCGAALKDYGHLLGTARAAAFSARVHDVHEWLAPRLAERSPGPPARRGPVIVQDPCHLRHVQKAHLPVRAVLAAAGYQPVELDDDGLCCGAGGAYAALEPELAGRIRDRKLAAVGRAREASGASVVASANPGCAYHLGAAGLAVVHPMDLVAAALQEDA